MCVVGSNPIARSNLLPLVLVLFAAGCRSAPTPTPEPRHTIADELAFLKQAPAPPPAVPCTTEPGRSHRVVKGETLYAIAKQYDVTVEALMRANRLRDARSLKTGQVLRIP